MPWLRVGLTNSRKRWFMIRSGTCCDLPVLSSISPKVPCQGKFSHLGEIWWSGYAISDIQKPLLGIIWIVAQKHRVRRGRNDCPHHYVKLLCITNVEIAVLLGLSNQSFLNSEWQLLSYHNGSINPDEIHLALPCVRSKTLLCLYHSFSRINFCLDNNISPPTPWKVSYCGYYSLPACRASRIGAESWYY